ncbi:hypothetical protein EIP91_002407 [Steccherinum ochraceum]|uniref:Transmembrane protein n=1 Tax=Steccherinum ochraceum TaxID=92696 RepID=A0A4R0RKQ3_9APHY|nr:hypothetical protein EIP91_002407 [Steccherinum ochraceum]
MESDRLLSTDAESLPTLPMLTRRSTAKSDLTLAPPPATEEKKNVDSDEMQRKKKRIAQATDLLLDVAMTTTFASLLDGTPVSDGKSLASFICLFALVWWTWASQVTYNARFREYDWIHRVFLCFQLLIFCAFAAFTNGFDITAGIVNDTVGETLKTLRKVEGWPQLTANAQASREAQIPISSVRGIAMTMAFSRALLFAQYLHALFYFKESKAKSAFYVHTFTLIISFACYFASFFCISSNPDEVTKGDQIAKVCLWYAPIFLELAAHFLAAHLSEDKEFKEMWYDEEIIYERSGSVFIIILGAGLDKITEGFHYLVGNPAFGPRRVGVIFSAGLIFICLFSLYFTKVRGRPLSSEQKKKRDEGEDSESCRVANRRVLLYFFLNFLYLCSIIVTLQGMAAMIQFGNVGDNMQTAFHFMRTSEHHLNKTNFVDPLNASIYKEDLVHKLSETGYDINDLVNDINRGIEISPDWNVTFAPFRILLLDGLGILTEGLQNTDALPTEQDSILTNEIDAFMDSDLSDVNKTQFIRIAQMVATSNATPALWFFSAGGAVLVMLAVLGLISHTDELNGYIFAQMAGRLTLGTVMLLLTALDVNAIAVQITMDYRFYGSRIWRLASQNWILPPYAAVLTLEQGYEYVLMYLSQNAVDAAA